MLHARSSRPRGSPACKSAKAPSTRPAPIPTRGLVLALSRLRGSPVQLQSAEVKAQLAGSFRADDRLELGVRLGKVFIDDEVLVGIHSFLDLGPGTENPGLDACFRLGVSLPQPPLQLSKRGGEDEDQHRVGMDRLDRIAPCTSRSNTATSLRARASSTTERGLP